MHEVKITMTKGTPCVSSLQVAEDFGKNHKDVLRAIENLAAQNCAHPFAFMKSVRLLLGGVQNVPRSSWALPVGATCPRSSNYTPLPVGSLCGCCALCEPVGMSH